MFETLTLTQLDESKHNPRKRIDDAKLGELAESIKALGVLEPVLVRPVAGRYEVLAGSRRVRAARQAGLTEIPARVFDLTDAEALEVAIVENLQREDVHPLEEAEGMERLLDASPSLTADDLAAKIGKSTSYVRQRLKLVALCKKGREAFYAGKLSASVALLIARIPRVEDQERALKELVRGDDGEPMTFRWAADVIHRGFLLALKDAPFDRKDAELVSKAGSCAECPKRSGAQPGLFDDVHGDSCTDLTCYQEKVAAAWKQRAKAAREAGREVLEGKDAREVFTDYGGTPALKYDAAYVDLDAPAPGDPKGRTLRKLVGKAGAEAAVLARDPSGGIRELVSKKAAGKLLKAAGHDFRAERAEVPGLSEEEKEAARKEKERREVDDAVSERSTVLVADALDTKDLDAEVWRLALRFQVLQSYGDAPDLERRFGKEWKEKLPAATQAMTARQLQGVILSGLLVEAQTHYSPEAKPVAAALRKWAGIDEKVLRKECAAALKASRKAGQGKGKKQEEEGQDGEPAVTTCDDCGRKIQGHHKVNGRKLCLYCKEAADGDE